MKRKLFTLLVLAALVCIAVPGFTVDERTVTITWDPPTHVIVGQDCANLGQPLTPEQMTDMVYELYISVDGQPFSLIEIVAVTQVVAGPYPVGSVLDSYVGAKRPNGNVACFSDHSTFTVPAILVGPCGTAPVFTVN